MVQEDSQSTKELNTSRNPFIYMVQVHQNLDSNSTLITQDINKNCQSNYSLQGVITYKNEFGITHFLVSKKRTFEPIAKLNLRFEVKLFPRPMDDEDAAHQLNLLFERDNHIYDLVAWYNEKMMGIINCFQEE